MFDIGIQWDYFQAFQKYNQKYIFDKIPNWFSDTFFTKFHTVLWFERLLLIEAFLPNTICLIMKELIRGKYILLIDIACIAFNVAVTWPNLPQISDCQSLLIKWLLKDWNQRLGSSGWACIYIVSNSDFCIRHPFNSFHQTRKQQSPFQSIFQ